MAIGELSSSPTTGITAGFFVLDVDPREGGDKALASLRAPFSIRHATTLFVRGKGKSNFEIDDSRYSDPSFDLDEAPDEFRDEFRARLDHVVGREDARFLYEYDFGDCCGHEIEVGRTDSVGG